MNKITFLIIFSTFFLSSLCGDCSYGGDAYLNLYTSINYGGSSYKVYSSNACVDLTERDYQSAKAGGYYKCTVYKSKGCPSYSFESKTTIDRNGNNFGFTAKSMKCPCY